MSMLTTSQSPSELVSSSFQEGMAARRSMATDFKDGERRRARELLEQGSGSRGESEQGSERAASGGRMGMVFTLVPTEPAWLTVAP